MWVLPCYVKITLSNALIFRMCAEDHISQFAASMHNEEVRCRTLLRF